MSQLLIALLLITEYQPARSTCSKCKTLAQCSPPDVYTFDCSIYNTLDYLYTNQLKIPAIIAGGRLLRWHNAANHFQHFIDNTGTPVSLDKNFLLDNGPVTELIESNINSIICGKSNKHKHSILSCGRKLATGQAFKEKMCFCDQSSATAGTDLYFASNKFSVHTSAKTCVRREDDMILFTMDEITHTFYDVYDWNPANHADYYCLEHAANLAKSFLIKTIFKTDEIKISGKLNINSFDCKYERDDSLDACKAPPLIFVVDITGSMSNDISAVRNKIQSKITATRGTINEPRLYVLSRFEAWNSVTSTTDADVMLIDVASLTAGSGGTENSMSAILDVIRFADENSVIMIFTDEDADDEELRVSVFFQLWQKKIKLVGSISGGFRRLLLSTGIDLYADLSFASGGLPIYTSHSGVTDIIDIIDPLTSRNAVTLANIVTETNTNRTGPIQIAIDSTIGKVTFIVSSSGSTTVPYINIYHDASIIVATNSIYAIEILTNGSNSWGEYNVTFGTTQTVDFVSLQIVAETLLSFEYDLSTDLNGDTSLFNTLYPSDTLTITVTPSDLSLINTIDYISIISLDGQDIINNNVSIGSNGYFAVFSPYDHQAVGNRFHVSVSGKDNNNYDYFRMMSREVWVQDLRIDILNYSDIDTDIVIGTWIDVLFQAVSVNVSQSDTIVFSATSNFQFDATLLVNPNIMNLNDIGYGTLSIWVDKNIGEELSVVLTAINKNTDEFAYTIFAFNIISNITDNKPTQFESFNITYEIDCNLYDPNLDNCSSWLWSSVIYIFDENGISWVSNINDDPYSVTGLSTGKTSNFTSGENELYLVYISSCCNTYSQFVVRDELNQISFFDFNVADKCETDIVFGDAFFNETVYVQCVDLKNNTFLTDGELSRKCKSNAQWEVIINGFCDAPNENDISKCFIGESCDKTEDCCPIDIDERSLGITCSCKHEKNKDDKTCCIKMGIEGCRNDDDCCGMKSKCVDNICMNKKMYKKHKNTQQKTVSNKQLKDNSIFSSRDVNTKSIILTFSSTIWMFISMALICSIFMAIWMFSHKHTERQM